MARQAEVAIAVLPLAALEQHGRYLPGATDSTLVTEIAQRAEASLTEKMVLLPILWVGCSHHHQVFGAL